MEGFREMTLGRTLWAIILIKLFVLFAVMKLFFMPDPLAGRSAEERSSHLLEELTPASALHSPASLSPATADPPAASSGTVAPDAAPTVASTGSGHPATPAASTAPASRSDAQANSAQNLKKR